MSGSAGTADDDAPPLVVTDSTALIGLERIQRLDLLPAVFPRVTAPPAVAGEFGQRPGWLAVPGPVDVPKALRVLRNRLDRGETEVIALALTLPDCAVLLDERRGRQVARRMGLETIGTLGLLLLAKQRGLVPVVEPLLDALASAGFYFSDALREEVLRQADEAR